MISYVAGAWLAVTPNDLGVPQGTPLSCLLFILYINAIVSVTLHCKISLFADDTLLWISADSLHDAISKINADLARITRFLKMLKLKLNVQKTKAMIINCRQEVNQPILIDGQAFEVVDSMKYLGVTVDNQLTFSENIKYISNKIAKKVALMGRLKRKVDRDTMLTLFKTTCTPHFDYCPSILLLASDSQFQQLQVLMNKALRIIENADRRTHIQCWRLLIC